MKYGYFLILLFTVGVIAQPSVRGKLALQAPLHDRDFIVRHTKVILVTKTSRDTVAINDKLEFEFPKANSGTAYLYLSSPVLPSDTQYKFRVKKHKPTSVSVVYDRFQAVREVNVKSAEDREDDFEKGLFIARLATDLFIFIDAVTR
jgi:hypothetical protein